MSSPYSTGGGGPQFEVRVTAYYCAAVLAEARGRALPGVCATEVLTQRAAFDEPLDDLVVNGLTNDGAATKLSLQVKSSLRFTESDEEWQDVLGQAWGTFKQETFDAHSHRIGVAVANYHAKADKHYQSVLTWASHSPSASDFFKRISREDFAHGDQREFVARIRRILGSHHCNEVSDEDLWKFLCVFRILHFDFNNEEASRDVASAIDRIMGILPMAERPKASQVWDRLIVRAGETTVAGGGETRTSLLSDLQTAGLPVTSNGTFRDDIEAIDRESKRAMESVKADIHGLKLKRNGSYDAVQDALGNGRFVQIDGEPGGGKSALLRQLAEEEAQTGPILFLRDMRVRPGGWGAHAGQLGISDKLEELLRELACIGNPLLFIDGLDKISDPAARLTINDIVRLIAASEALADWKILATVREQNFEHIATWLDPEAMKRLPIRTVTVPPLGSGELKIVGNEFPRLAPLLRETEHADVILQRPFFLDAMIGLAGRTGQSRLPASEAELLELWWHLGGSDNPDFNPAQDRRNALLELAERFVMDPAAPVPIRDIPPGPLGDLKNAGVILDVRLGHTVTFSHDIYEEWSLTHWLMNKLPNVSEALQDAGELQELVRPLQLLGSHLLESDEDAGDWRELFDSVNRESLRPVWQRSLLTSCLRSTRSTGILNKLSELLAENDHAVLKKLLNALQTLEVVPNTSFLDEKALPDLEPDERVRYSHQFAHPKAYTWARVLDWLFSGDADPPPELIPELVPAFMTWQSTFAGLEFRHCRRIGKVSYRWLVEFEAALHPDRWEDRREPFGIEFPYDRKRDLEKELRSLTLRSAGDVPTLVAGYLKAKAARGLAHLHRREIMNASNTIAQFLPEELAEYVMTAFFRYPWDDASPSGRSRLEGRDLGLADNSSFFPASPLQPPFLALLQRHPEHGLRLVREMCNFSTDVWQWLRERGDGGEKGARPVPVEIEFPWGTRTFRGDACVYGWFRGGHGNHACQSALMALEWWAFERIEAGADVAEVIRHIVEGSESVAALGVAVSVCIANVDRGLEPLLPFMTCPHVWQWDLDRSVGDQTGSHANEIGDWWRDRALLAAIRELNQKPHRKTCIRDVVPYFVLSDDDELRERYATGIRSFAERLPFELEHEKDDDGTVEGLRRSMQWIIDQADPKHWQIGPTEDGKRIQLWNDPPSANDPDRLAFLERFAEQSRYLRLAHWARNCLEVDALDDEIPLADAVTEARELDAGNLFETEGADFDIKARAAAIAGVAFAAARFAEDADWTGTTAKWSVDILRRASGFTSQGELTFRGSVLSMDPLEFAAQGNVALVARGHDPEAARRQVLELALHPLEAVAEAIAKASATLEENASDFLWEVFVVLVGRCICTAENAPNYRAAEKSDSEAAYHAELIASAERAIQSGTANSLPDIPLPWIESGETDAAEIEGDTGGFERNTVRFLSSVAQKTILIMDFDALMASEDRRSQVLRLVGQLVEMTFQEMDPPFADSRRDFPGSGSSEWAFSLFFWLGKFCGPLTPAEVDDLVLRPITRAGNESGLEAMAKFCRGYSAYNILPPAEPGENSLEVWNRIANWVIEHPEGRSIEHMGREYQSSVLALLFCFHGDFSPLICAAERDWPHLGRFTQTFGRVFEKFGTNSTTFFGIMKFLQKGGLEFFPDPALSWLARIAQDTRHDKTFWSANGEETVSMLKLAFAEKGAELSDGHRKSLSFIIDVLVDNGVRGAGFLQQDQHRRT